MITNNYLIVLKFISYSFYFPFSLLTFLLMRIISPIKVIKFGMLNSHRVGHFSIEWEIYWQLNLNNKKKIVLLSFQKDVSNTFLAKMIKRKITIYPAKYIKLIQILNNSIFGDKKHEINFHHYVHDQSNKLNNFTPSLRFTKNEIYKGDKILKKFTKEKIVCLLCRDGEYISKKYKTNDTDNIRNSNINDYIKAIKALEKKGYTIFRMGKNVKSKLRYTSKRVIDYATSNFRSDFMDIFLSKKCDFFVSTGGGLDGVAIMFNKPILYVNYIPVGEWPVGSEKFLFSFKKYYDYKKKKYLSLSSIFKNDLAYNYYKKKELKNMGYSLKDMTIDEIKEVFLEMDEFYKKKNLTKKQILFKKKFRILIKKYPNKDDYFGKIFPTISKNFLRKNSFYIN